MIFNNDSTSVYSTRYTVNGSGSYTHTNVAYCSGIVFNSPYNFGNMFILNDQTSDKMTLIEENNGATAGSGTVPNFREVQNKWAENSNQITRIEVKSGTGGDWASGSKLRVWGAD